MFCRPPDPILSLPDSLPERLSLGYFMEIFFLLPVALLNHLIRPREQVRRKCQADLFRCLQVDHELKLRCLLHRQISRFATFQDLVDVNNRAPKEVTEVRPVGHKTAFIDKLLLEVNSRQPVFDGKLDDPLSFGEKGATCGRFYNRAHLLLLCSFKGAL